MHGSLGLGQAESILKRHLDRFIRFWLMLTVVTNTNEHTGSGPYLAGGRPGARDLLINPALDRPVKCTAQITDVSSVSFSIV